MRDGSEMTPFEEQLARDLRRHAAAVDDPRSAADIAAVAMRLGRRSRFATIGRFANPFATLPAVWRPIVLAALLGLAILAALAVAGSRPHRPLAANGSLAYEAQASTGLREVIGLLDPSGARSIVPSDPALIDFCPTWSGDGSRIAYEALGADRAEIVVTDVTGADPRVMVTDLPIGQGSGPTSLAWSPDDTLIAYVDSGKLWVVPAAGGAPQMVVDSIAQGSSAVWSPDGRRLVAVTYDGATPVLETIGVDGSGGQALVRIGQLTPPVGFAWSPDGATIAYASGGRLWTVPADGSGTPVDVTGGALSAMTPYWSPDSTHIAFIDAVAATAPPPAVVTYPGERFSDTTQVWIVDRDGSHGRLLATLPPKSGFDHLTWSPDGRSLLAAEETVGPATSGTVSYVQVPVAGGPPVVIATSKEPGGPFPGLGNSCPVSWQRLPGSPSP
jgi:Tol biopolymer transport system component